MAELLLWRPWIGIRDVLAKAEPKKSEARLSHRSLEDELEQAGHPIGAAQHQERPLQWLGSEPISTPISPPETTGTPPKQDLSPLSSEASLSSPRLTATKAFSEAITAPQQTLRATSWAEGTLGELEARLAKLVVLQGIPYG